MLTYNRIAVLIVGVVMVSVFFSSCAEKARGPVIFDALTSERTGLNFANTLRSTDSFNLFGYMYFYNGAGVGAGDFNNDGLVDLFFASNQGKNSIFLNRGNLQFTDVTAQTGIADDGAWNTGVSVVDINNDGLLDIYVSRVGKYLVLNSHNQFLICQGIDKNGVPRYADKAKELGLDFSGFGTQAAFLDYDLDGDLDVFLLNHSVHQNGSFSARSAFAGTYHPTAGSRFYRNDGGAFTNVTESCGINSSAIGYGLGVTVSDINLDGYPDMYVGNDFHENDYLYINMKNGRFTDASESSLMHTSRYTMGVDVADASNDGFPDIVSVDMLASDPIALKRSPGEDSYDVFNLRLEYGYNYQYSRNALQLNRGNGKFSETALYSGVAATDWSWSPLWMDFNNDGIKDLFISNGIPKRLNDIDYINYISDQSIQQQIRDNKISEKDETLIEKFSKVKIANKFYLNSDSLKFTDLQANIGNNMPSYSNGAVYADFDNDGDLDIVVNNIDDKAVLYRNTTNDSGIKSFIKLKLKGFPSNVNATGSKVIIYAGSDVRTYEKYPVRGFLSSMETPMHIGLDATAVDSLVLVWPDNTYQRIDTHKKNLLDSISYQTGLPAFNYAQLTRFARNRSFVASDITDSVELKYRHQENSFPEFNSEPLIPHMVSREGPATAVADVNHDGLDDAFLGSSKMHKSGLFIQQPSGRFIRSLQPALDADSSFEDVDAVFSDVNGDGHPDLLIASGGNEYYGEDRHLLPRLYLNNGSGNFERKMDAFDKVFQTAGCVAASDFNDDGYPDLFIGGRVHPREYGRMPSSYLLQNDGKGKFTDVTGRYSNELGSAGFVTKALWYDLDNDQRRDLIVCSEWGTIDAYLNKRNTFEKKILSDKKGWWNFILPVDVDMDGNVDLIAGNLGLNTRLHASVKEPVRMYYNDFDDNGKKEQVLTYYLNGRDIPFASKAEIERQLPNMRKRFLYANDFARADLDDLFGSDKLAKSEIYSADYFANCIMMNRGNLRFDVQPLGWQMQLSSFRDAVVLNLNGDSLPDILLGGNYYDHTTEMGRSDGDFGSLLINKGKGRFDYEKLDGRTLTGQVRSIKKLMTGKTESWLVARNDDSALVIKFEPPGKK